MKERLPFQTIPQDDTSSSDIGKSGTKNAVKTIGT